MDCILFGILIMMSYVEHHTEIQPTEHPIKCLKLKHKCHHMRFHNRIRDGPHN
jgi:hypothetical protein